MRVDLYKFNNSEKETILKCIKVFLDEHIGDRNTDEKDITILNCLIEKLENI